MQFTTRKDVEAPQDFVFAAASDFSVFERHALRRDIDIQRTGEAGPDGTGLGWRIRFRYRNQLRTLDARIATFDRPTGFILKGVSGGTDLEGTVELMPLSRTATRIFLTLDLLPRGLAARFLVQSLRFVKASLDRKFEARAAALARDIEDRFRATS